MRPELLKRRLRKRSWRKRRQRKLLKRLLKRQQRKSPSYQRPKMIKIRPRLPQYNHLYLLSNKRPKSKKILKIQNRTKNLNNSFKLKNHKASLASSHLSLNQSNLKNQHQSNKMILLLSAKECLKDSKKSSMKKNKIARRHKKLLKNSSMQWT